MVRLGIVLTLLSFLLLFSCAPMPFMSPGTWTELAGSDDGGDDPIVDDPVDDDDPPIFLPDDGEDDTAGLQAALDQAGPSGVLEIPAGTYIISAPLVPPDGVIVRGDPAGETILTAGLPGEVRLLDSPTVNGITLSDLVLHNLSIALGAAASNVEIYGVVFIADASPGPGWLVAIDNTTRMKLADSAFLAAATALDLEGALRIVGATAIDVSDNLIGVDLALTELTLKMGNNLLLARLDALLDDNLITSTAMDHIPNGIFYSGNSAAEPWPTTDARIVNNMFNGADLADPGSGRGYAIACRMLNGVEIGGNYVEGFSGSSGYFASALLLFMQTTSFSHNHLVGAGMHLGITGVTDVRTTSKVWLAANTIDGGVMTYADEGDSSIASDVSEIAYSANQFVGLQGSFEFTNDFLSDHDDFDLTVDLQNIITDNGSLAPIYSDPNVGEVATPTEAVMPSAVTPYYNPSDYKSYN